MRFHIVLVLNLVCYSANGMLVKSWGTSLKINWLRWSVNDIFSEAVNLITLGQNGVHPVNGFRKTFNATDGNPVIFETYNGWLENLQLDIGTTSESDLRRVIMTRAERYLHEKAAGIKDKPRESAKHRGLQHEMIICLECMALTINRIHYAYRAEMNSTEDSTSEPIPLWTAGTLQNQQALLIPITFQMSIMVSHVHGTGSEENITSTMAGNSKKQCIILLEPLQLTVSPLWWPTIATKIGRFSFLADHVDEWLEKNFKNSTLPELRTSLDRSVRKILHTRNICLEILLKDNDSA